MRIQLAAYQGTCAVGCQQGLHRHSDDAVVSQVANLRGLTQEVRRLESMPEMQLDPGKFRSHLDQSLIEPMPGHRIDHLIGPLPVGLKCSVSILIVNEPTAHGQQRRRHIVKDTSHFQSVNSSIGQSQIDRSARLRARVPRIGARFVQCYLESAALQEDGEQRARWTCADNAYHEKFMRAKPRPKYPPPPTHPQTSCTAGSSQAAA